MNSCRLTGLVNTVREAPHELSAKRERVLSCRSGPKNQNREWNGRRKTQRIRKAPKSGWWSDLPRGPMRCSTWTDNTTNRRTSFILLFYFLRPRQGDTYNIWQNQVNIILKKNDVCVCVFFLTFVQKSHLLFFSCTSCKRNESENSPVYMLWAGWLGWN